MVVEGQTEEQFLKIVLAPIALTRACHVQPIVVRNKRTKTAGHKGGGGSWQHYRDHVRALATQPQWDRIGVMFDLYACPSDTPGYDASLNAPQRHAAVAKATQQDLERLAPRVLSGPVLHELETLVIAAIATGATEATADVVEKAHRAIAAAGGVELINGSPQGAPSKRLAAWWPGYEKVLYGAVLLSEPPWEAIADQCPTFESWWENLLG